MSQAISPDQLEALRAYADQSSLTRSGEESITPKKVPENGVEVIAAGPPRPPPGACLRTGRKLALLNTARRRAQAVHRAADQANPL
jgi:hypothetical protein